MDEKVALADLEQTSSEFYIPARESLAERRPLTLKHGEAFAVLDNHGDVLAHPGNPEGLFFRDTRHLSHCELRLNGARPLLLTSTMQDNNAALVVDLTNPDFYEAGRVVLPKDTLHLHRAKFAWRGGLYERLSVFNYGDVAHKIRLSLVFDADFSDLFEARGQERSHRGTREVKVDDGTILFRYRGLDDVTRETRVSAWPQPSRLLPSALVYELDLAPRQRATICTRISCSHGVRRAEPWDGRRLLADMTEARRALRISASRAASIDSSSSLVNEIARRSVADLYMLVTDTEYGPYPCAGIPWFSTPFGRDGIITALFMLWLDPEIARGVLSLLAATQATETNAVRDSEPGKILHEMRAGEMAALGEVPFGLYYGSVDSTPLFIVLAGEYWRRTGDEATLRALWPNVEAALDWIETHGDIDGDGFVEYHRQTDTGLINQGWKDSHDSVFHADGSTAHGPIALVEVQAYVFAAYRHAAAMASALGRDEMAAALCEKAERLRLRFEDTFWLDDLGIYALALDGEKRPCRIVTSNAGHALYAGIATPERAARVAATLMAPPSFSGWGIRTLAAGQERYNPMSYHNGSVWPHDNALVGLGFARYRLKDAVLRVLGGMVDAAAYQDLRRLPELFCGFRRKTHKGPTAYPVACAPQAWAAAAPLALLQASIGLEIEHSRGEVRLDRPVLPDFLERVDLRNVRLGPAGVDLSLTRHDGDVSVNVTERRGEITVVAVH